MYRIALVLVVLLAVAGCGGEKNETPRETASTTPPPQEQGRPAIPDEGDMPTETAGYAVTIYGDEAGTMTELAVTPGETFDVYVLGEVETDQYRVAAVQFRLVLPFDVTILSQHKSDARTMSVGDPEENFNLAFRCKDAGIFTLMRYTCQASSEFKGGKIEVGPGVNANAQAFLGYVTCPDDGTPIKLPCSGGSLELTVN